MKIRLHIERMVFDRAPWAGGNRRAFERSFADSLQRALLAHLARATPATRRAPQERVTFDAADAADPNALAAALAAHIMGAA